MKIFSHFEGKSELFYCYGYANNTSDKKKANDSNNTADVSQWRI